LHPSLGPGVAATSRVPTVGETTRTLRLLVLALVVLLIGTIAVCGLQPRTAVELPRRGAQEIRSCEIHQLLVLAGRPPRGPRNCPDSGVSDSDPRSSRLIGPIEAPCERLAGLSG